MNDTISELTALEAKATPGPWHVDDKHPGPHIRHEGQGWPIASMWTTRSERVADAALIVAMRNALPEVLDELKRSAIRKHNYDAAIARAEKSEADQSLLFDEALRQKKRAIQAEAERDWLIGKIVERGNADEHAFCPNPDAGCASVTYDCAICWHKYATQEAAKREGGDILTGIERIAAERQWQNEEG